jgi:hypothetical protein
MLTLIVFMIAIGFIESIEAKKVSCEKIENMLWDVPVGIVKACIFETTIINERNTMISTKDTSVRGLVINTYLCASLKFIQIWKFTRWAKPLLENSRSKTLQD